MFSPTKNDYHEYLSWLYKNPDGTISYTVPILHPGGPDGGATSHTEDIESKLVGFAHTHRSRNELPDSFYKTKTSSLPVTVFVHPAQEYHKSPLFSGMILSSTGLP